METTESIDSHLSLIRSTEDSFLYYIDRERLFVALSSGFNINNISIEHEINDPIENLSTNKISLRTVDIIPGNDCNLGCSYCYRICNSKTISSENIQQGIAFIKNICDQDNLEFCFIGGEPLLYLDEVKASVDCILASFPKAIFVIVTNGTLFTDSICEYLSAKNFHTIVSVDGNKERHNKARVLKNDQAGSFEIVDIGLDMLKKYKINYALCVTIDEHNCKWFVDDIEWLMERYQPDDLHVNGILHNADQKNISVAAFAQGLTSLFDKFNEKSKSLPEQVKRWFLPFISRSEKMHFDCAAFGRKIVMSPDGYHVRSEERRVGKECRSRWSPYH